jgi:hypothetical protein
MRLLYTIHFTFKEGFRVCPPSNEFWELCESKRDPGISHPETRNSQIFVLPAGALFLV